ncbi:uncharacterized protein METZ01_LOCUS350406, partial [marine metagenome]
SSVNTAAHAWCADSGEATATATANTAVYLKMFILVAYSRLKKVMQGRVSTKGKITGILLQ